MDEDELDLVRRCCLCSDGGFVIDVDMDNGWVRGWDVGLRDRGVWWVYGAEKDVDIAGEPKSLAGVLNAIEGSFAEADSDVSNGSTVVPNNRLL